MAEYDAFGRKIGDDPLEQRPAPPEPSASPVPAAGSAPRSLSGPKVLLLIVGSAVVVATAAIGLAIALLGASAEEEIASETIVAEKTTRGLDAGSLLTRAALTRAVDALRAGDFGRPVSIRVAADRVDAEMVTANGRLSDVQIGLDGARREVASEQFGPEPSMPWEAVDPGAPERLVRAAAEREKRPAADVDYLVLLDLGQPTWGLFFEGGTHYQGDAAGRLLRRVSP